MADTRPFRPAFLRIPLELRLQIYEIAIDQRLGYHPKYYMCISAVSKQIRQEVLPIFFQNSRHFPSLDRLSNWTSRGHDHLLKQVENVSLHMFESSLSAIYASPRRYLTDSTAISPVTGEWWEAEYTRRAGPIIRAESESPTWRSLSSRLLRSLRISASGMVFDGRSNINPILSAWKAFTAINEVKKLWLLFQDGGHLTGQRPIPRSSNTEQQLILDMISTICQNLQELTVFSNLLHLDYIRNFRDLRLLRFSGHSKSSPEEMLDILRSLKKLESVIVFRYPDFYDKDNSIVTAELPKCLSLTAKVIEKLNPLKNFQVQHASNRTQSSHITIPIIKALEAHINSLRILHLHSDYPFEEEVIDALLHFLRMSRIMDLRLNLIVPAGFEYRDIRTYFPKAIRQGQASFQKPVPPFLLVREPLVYLRVTASTIDN